jgi:hypothetical protein
MLKGAFILFNSMCGQERAYSSKNLFFSIFFKILSERKFLKIFMTAHGIEIIVKFNDFVIFKIH